MLEDGDCNGGMGAQAVPQGWLRLEIVVFLLRSNCLTKWCNIGMNVGITHVNNEIFGLSSRAWNACGHSTPGGCGIFALLEEPRGLVVYKSMREG